MAGVTRVTGVRVYDVGQGDAVALLDQDEAPFLQIDYGGRQGNPFAVRGAQRIDKTMPVRPGSLLVLTHWDEDHWFSARRGGAARQATWLVPRQLTSPRAVMFSADLDEIYCVPEKWVGNAKCFVASNGDAFWWEKIGSAPRPPASHEDCNLTGLACSIVRAEDKSVILLPGDAPLHAVGHYKQYLGGAHLLRGLVAFHHGSKSDWNRTTRHLLRGFAARSPTFDIAFSCANPNPYNHPHIRNYLEAAPRATAHVTANLRSVGRSSIDILF
ncbi:hypothetical protein HIV01_012320 [Lysobacter arenosi]|uniref:Metallo-beta-lactamase domain-containing protein n=1 Tax=Lysobacter arenosi TaxID=2795387 RepID=A0ABX7R798_9GAMM|nr:hypothetical protein [Lysobacter arenosi]QSX74002.1 hypothetical protein HIV01_012320 [Lysobacter arenosi]